MLLKILLHTGRKVVVNIGDLMWKITWILWFLP